jgi:diguanylate cyclase (GGDEF)-like protein
MLRVAACLTTEHDWRLVVLAGAICVLTSIAAMCLFRRALATTQGPRLLWLATTGMAAGYGIWATHFIAMLAYTPGLPVGYDLPITFASLVAAVVITGAGFSLAAMNPFTGAVLLGGATTGLGIAVMHYTGMQALEVPGHVVWSPDLVLTSILLGVGFAVPAVSVASHQTSPRPPVLSAALLALAILALHFTAMGAVEIRPDPTVPFASLALSANALSLAIASAAVAVLGVSLAAALSARSRQQLIESADAEIARQARRFETAVANMTQGLCMFDADQRVVVANPRYAGLYGLDLKLTEPGTTLREILEARVASGVYGDIDADAFIEAAIASFHLEVTEILHLADGRFISVLRRPMADGGLVSTHEDITDRRRAEARITHLAHHDALTDLPNRTLLRERLEGALASARRDDRAFALLALDLDRFKEVNDTLGHPTGDALLQAVAQRLLGCVREGDTVARLGGDEFAIVQRASDVGTESDALAQRIVQMLGSPFELEGHHILVGTSVGIALAPQDGDDPDELLRSADLALYRAKSNRGGNYLFFEPEMNQRLQARRSLEADLRSALADHAFALHYQPLVKLQSDEICGFEALLRWHHPERGNVPPDEFIPIAEETGLIIPLGEWVLRQACSDAANWPDHLKIAVNVSPAQFKKRSLTDIVIHALAATNMPPHRLELEITESVVLEDQDAAFEELARLHDLGVRIALDDFGTGYSSLSYLQSFPFDKIKIDRAFVANLAHSQQAVTIIRAVIALSRGLNLPVVAEGVETEEQVRFLAAEHCSEIQGYLVGRPKPIADYADLVGRQPAPRREHKLAKVG